MLKVIVNEEVIMKMLYLGYWTKKELKFLIKRLQELTTDGGSWPKVVAISLPDNEERS